MAQTKKKRQTKHRGNAAGAIEVRGRTSRPPSPEERKRVAKETARAQRLSREPSWKVSVRNAALMSVGIFVVLVVVDHLGHDKHGSVASAAILAVVLFAVYTPASFLLERMMWKKRMRNTSTSGVKRDR